MTHFESKWISHKVKLKFNNTNVFDGVLTDFLEYLNRWCGRRDFTLYF